MNVSVLITRAKDSDFVRELRSFYKDEPWSCTLMLSAALFFTGGFSYLAILLIHVSWPVSLYVLLSIAAIITTARQILNWVTKD